MFILESAGDLIAVLTDLMGGLTDLLTGTLEFEGLSSGSSVSTFGSSEEAAPVTTA